MQVYRTDSSYKMRQRGKIMFAIFLIAIVALFGPAIAMWVIAHKLASTVMFCFGAMALVPSKWKDFN